MDAAQVATYQAVEKKSSGSSSSMWIAIVALIFAIIALVILIVWAIAYAATSGNPGPRVTGCKFNPVTGISSGTTDSFYASGCSAYQSQALTSGTSLTLTIKGPGKAKGQYFVIDNTLNPNDLLIRGDTGISVTGNTTIPAGVATQWYWNTDTSIVLIQ